MARDRKLGIPVFEVSDEPDEEGVYTAEQVSGIASDGREQKRRAREESPEAQRREFDRARQAEADAARSAAAAGDPTAQLKYDSWQAGMQLMSGLRRSGITNPATSTSSKRPELSAWQRAYATTMVFGCLRPLHQGLKAESITEVVGLGAMMWLCSPSFRAVVGSSASQVHSAITNKIARRGEHRAQAGVEGAQHKGIDPKTRWVRRLDRIATMDRHGLPPFTAQSAAMMEVGIAENAYFEMRAPGANPEAVMGQYKLALNELYSMAQKDGIEAAEISKSMRSIVGLRVAGEPHLAQVFMGLSHGVYALDKTNGVYDIRSNSYVDRGSFNVRMPQSAEAHREAIENTLSIEFTSAMDQDISVVEAKLYAYAVGLQTSTYPEVVDRISEPSLRRNFQTSRGMFVAMADDGLSLDDAREAYTSAFVGAVGKLANVSPEFAAHWYGPDGEQWRQRLGEQLRLFDEYGRQSRGQDREDAEEASRSEHMHADEQSMWDVPSSREDVVDAEIIEDEEATWTEGRPAAQSDTERGQDENPLPIALPPVETFSATGAIELYRPKQDLPVPREHAALLESMAVYMGSDILSSAHVDRGVDPEGNSWLPRAVYSSPSEALRRASGLDERNDLSSMDGDAMERSFAMRSMQQKMQQLGMAASEQHKMFAAAYVRGLEKAVLADPSFERVVQHVAASPTAPAWQEIEFARTLAQTHTASPTLSYRAYITSHGMDPEVLSNTAENEPVHYAQVHQAQAIFESSMPSELRGEMASPTADHQADERSRRRSRTRFIRGWINREYNAEGEDAQILDPETDAQFSLTD